MSTVENELGENIEIETEEQRAKHRSPTFEGLTPIDILPDQLPRKVGRRNREAGGNQTSKWIGILQEVANKSNGTWLIVITYTNRQGASQAIKNLAENQSVFPEGVEIELAERKVQKEDGDVVSVLYARTVDIEAEADETFEIETDVDYEVDNEG